MQVFRANILACMSSKDFFAYSTTKFKHRPIYPEIVLHRAVLTDMFRESGGYLLRQKTLKTQLLKLCNDIDKPCSEAHAEQACYRIRAMMSQLRQMRCDSRAPPKGYEMQLKPILELISTREPLAQDSLDASDEEEPS